MTVAHCPTQSGRIAGHGAPETIQVDVVVSGALHFGETHGFVLFPIGLGMQWRRPWRNWEFNLLNKFETVAKVILEDLHLIGFRSGEKMNLLRFEFQLSPPAMTRTTAPFVNPTYS